MAYLIEKANIQNDIPSAETPKYEPGDYFLVSDFPEAVTSKKWPGFTILSVSILSFAKKYRKKAGDAIEEMSQAEKAVVDQVEADAAAEAIENAKDITIAFDKLLKSFALVVLDEINNLRQIANLPERTIDQLKTAVKDKYDAI